MSARDRSKLTGHAARTVAYWRREADALRGRLEAVCETIEHTPGVSDRILRLAQHAKRSVRTGTLEWAQTSELLACAAIVGFCGRCHAALAASAAPAECDIERLTGECGASGAGT